MNKYLEMKNRQQKEFDEFANKNMFFAFSDKQFEEGMQKLGLQKDDTDKIYRTIGGGFVLRTASKEMNNIFKRHEQERKDAIEADKDGTGFIYDMFDYELANHEYGYTGDSEEAVEALGLTYEEIEQDVRLKEAFNKAKKHQIEMS